MSPIATHTCQPFWRAAAAMVVLLVLAGCAEREPEPANQSVEGGVGAVSGIPMDTTPAGTPAPPTVNAAATDTAGAVTARLYEWEIDLSRDTVAAGQVTFRAVNTGTMAHALEVEGQGIEQETEEIQPGSTATLTVTLTPGSYEVYCPIVSNGMNHQQQGMTTTLVVR